ncbi:MAG: 50S ribosomal protein L11 methyltransferase [Pseudomonadota bacterium]
MQEADEEVISFEGIGTNRLIIANHPEVLTPTEYAITFGKIIWSRELSGKRVLDVGCGSGILSIIAAIQGAEVWATDISPHAIEMTKFNAKRNGVEIEQLVQENVLDAFLQGGEFESVKFDTIICNNPSLPGKDSSDLSRSGFIEWNQNGDGRYILDQLLLQGRNVLTEQGSLITHSSSEQRWNDTAHKLGKHWDDWQILMLLELAVEGDYYADALSDWLARGTIYNKRKKLMHTVTIFEAYASARPADLTREHFFADKLLSETMIRKLLDI